jgi:drug/metabolite transporter (DMT)-like permease
MGSSEREAGHPSASTAWIALITLYIVWGTTYLGIEKVNASIPPLVGAGFRFVIAGGLLFAFRWIRTRTKPERGQWRSAGVIGIFLVFGGNAFVAMSEKTVPTGIVALIIALVPIWITLIDRVVLHDVLPSRRTFVGLLAGFAGAAVLVGTSVQGHISVVGLLFAVAASLLWATGSIYARRASLPDDALMASGMQQLLGGIVVLVAATISGQMATFHPSAITTSSWLGFLYLLVFGSFVGFSCYLWLLRNVRTSLVSTYAYVNPVVAVALGVVVLDEALSGRELVAGAVILASVALIVVSGGLHRTDADARTSHVGEEGRPEIETELPFEGGGSAEQRLFAQDGSRELKPDR